MQNHILQGTIEHLDCLAHGLFCKEDTWLSAPVGPNLTSHAVSTLLSAAAQASDQQGLTYTE